MTREELATECKKLCAECAKGHVAHFRPGTVEWAHTVYRGTAVHHSLCAASSLRNQFILESKRDGQD